MNEEHRKILNLLEKGKIEQALKELKSFLSKTGNKELLNEVSELSGSYYSLKRDHSIPVISDETYRISMGRIRERLLKIVNKESLDDKSSKKGSSFFHWVIIGIASLLIIASGGVYFYLENKNKAAIVEVPPPIEEFFSQKIDVVTSDGKKIVDLTDNDSLIIDFGTERFIARIEQLGRATFNELPIEYNGKQMSVLLNSKKYEVTNYHKKYRFSKYLVEVEVKKKKVEKVVEKPEVIRSTTEKKPTKETPSKPEVAIIESPKEEKEEPKVELKTFTLRSQETVSNDLELSFSDDNVTYKTKNVDGFLIFENIPETIMHKTFWVHYQNNKGVMSKKRFPFRPGKFPPILSKFK